MRPARRCLAEGCLESLAEPNGPCRAFYIRELSSPGFPARRGQSPCSETLAAIGGGLSSDRLSDVARLGDAKTQGAESRRPGGRSDGISGRAFGRRGEVRSCDGSDSRRSSSPLARQNREGVLHVQPFSVERGGNEQRVNVRQAAILAADHTQLLPVVLDALLDRPPVERRIPESPLGSMSRGV